MLNITLVITSLLFNFPFIDYKFPNSLIDCKIKSLLIAISIMSFKSCSQFSFAYPSEDKNLDLSLFNLAASVKLTVLCRRNYLPRSHQAHKG